MAFLRDVFGATGEVQGGRPAEVSLNGSTIMVSAAGEDPVDTFYGDRRAMVADPFGNVFQIAHRLDGGS